MSRCVLMLRTVESSELSLSDVILPFKRTHCISAHPDLNSVSLRHDTMQLFFQYLFLFWWHISFVYYATAAVLLVQYTHMLPGLGICNRSSNVKGTAANVQLNSSLVSLRILKINWLPDAFLYHSMKTEQKLPYLTCSNFLFYFLWCSPLSEEQPYYYSLSLQSQAWKKTSF